MNIPENFLIYLDSLMNILFSACKLALTIDENVTRNIKKG